MWSLILYFLFGIGQPSNAQQNTGTPTVQTADTPPPNPGDDGDGGDKGNPPPKG
ncbi:MULTISPECIES: hypothetical protein [Sphingobacterium]|jgi:hypothetical protein|uniref:hypothetical protein n=1 Tax=Sphingobacterium TaxID=28453 RepID=UPI0012F993BE|nr:MULTISPECIES: hypothetical protein [Sphingobacterium]UQA76658.1 hypothetical protein K2F45_06610 [Sphingobacterium siyangense]